MASNSTSFENAISYFGPLMHSSNQFDFSPLFEFTVLSILPSGLLLLVLPFRLRSLYKQSRKVSKTLVQSNKVVLFAILTVFQTAILLLYATNSNVRTPATLAAATLLIIVALGLSFLSYVEHVRSVRPSTIINGYLLIALIFDGAQTRTLWVQHAPRSIAVVFSMTIVVKLAIAVMEAAEKRKILLAEYQKASPESVSGIYSRALFWWLNTLMTIGFRRVIKEDDLFPIEEEMSSVILGTRAQDNWSKADKTCSNALFWSTLRSTSRQFVVCILPRIFLVGFRYAQPLLISRTSDFVKSSTDTKNIGWGLTGAFGIVFLGAAVTNALYSHMTFRFSTALRGSLVSMICVKTVELRITSLDESAALMLMSTDTETICTGFQNLHEIWAVPVELGISLWLLQREVGLSFVAPAAIAIISTGATVGLSKYIRSSQKFWNEGIQTRVDVTTQVLGSMKAVKMLGITPKISETLQNLRVKELNLSTPFRRLLTLTSFFSNNMRVLAPFVTFAVFVLVQSYTQQKLTASMAFTTLALVGMLSNPVGTLVRTIPLVVSAMASFERIQKFLESPSLRTYIMPLEDRSGVNGTHSCKPTVESIIHSNEFNVPDEQFAPQNLHLQPAVYDDPTMIEVHKASFSWSSEGPPIIKDATFSILRGELVFVIGPVGCGKSTLLNGLMSETPTFEGKMYSNALECAFVDQTPWIQNTTIQRNITGPSTLDAAYYKDVVRSCALDHDIAVLPRSHDTIVGSKGISLSGGQKQRIALARALYAKKDLIIIDDGFSGLDAQTEDIVFTNLFGEQGLVKKSNTTVILVTNAVHRLSYANRIISLDSTGHIIEQGSFAQLQSACGYVESISAEYDHEPKQGINKMSTAAPSAGFERILKRNAKVVVEEEEEEDDLNRQIGEWSTYKYYFASIGWLRTLFSLFYLVLSGVAVKIAELLITYWTGAVLAQGNGVNQLYLGLYGLLAGVGTIFWNIAVYHYFLYVVPSSAEELHARLLNSVMNAPLYFFTSTDTGAITNRFSQDMSVVDKELPFALIDLIVAVVQTVMGAILMCFVTGYFAFILPPVFGVVWLIQKFYLRTSRQVRLLDLEAKSPLYTHLIETLAGLISIRAFGWSENFVNQTMILLDNSQKPFYLLFCVQRWLALVLDLMVAVLAVILMVLIVELRDSVSPGYVGLALLNVMGFSASLTWIVKQWTSLETSIGAISRLKNFTSNTPDENLESGDEDIPDDWPVKGKIELRNVSSFYCPGGIEILKNITMSIKPGEKIGICGRTGSGKSSLIMMLLRLLEISSNSILIDGIDITKVSRQETRSRINGIPQDSFLLKGTARFNVSPENNHTDSEMIDALRKVELWPVIEQKGGLDAELDIGSLSNGQRQLFCLARAILRRSNIVLLDEISSSLDVATDKLIQRVIRTEFSSSTIISVAHRLDTILDFDRIALLSNGKVIEFEDPKILLSRPSAFRELYNSC